MVPPLGVIVVTETQGLQGHPGPGGGVQLHAVGHVPGRGRALVLPEGAADALVDQKVCAKEGAAHLPKLQ